MSGPTQSGEGARTDGEQLRDDGTAATGESNTGRFLDVSVRNSAGGPDRLASADSRVPAYRKDVVTPRESPYERSQRPPLFQNRIAALDASSNGLNIGGLSHAGLATKLRSEISDSWPELATPEADSAHELDAYREALVYEYGEYFDSYLATEPGRLEFWSSSHEGLISYTRRGRYLLIGGGLIAPDEHRPVLLREFVEYLQKNRLVASFHNIADHELPLFRELGFQITKWGEEPVIDLGSITWQGKEFEWVRRQTNYCRRQGLEAFEVVPHELSPAQWNKTYTELLEVSTESLATKPQREMTFFEGTIDKHEIGLRRVFLVRADHGLGRIESFVVCTPMRNGTMWATELYRRRSDAVRGAMGFLFRHVIDTLQQEGVERVGLCLDPALRCCPRMPGDSPLIRLGMTWGEAVLGVVFDLAGIRHFKSRFRPRYESRYVCVTPKASIRSILAFAHVSGLFAIKPWTLLKITMERFRKRSQRKNLAEID